MHVIPTRVLVATTIAISVGNLGLMAGQLTGNFHLPTLSGFNQPFDNSQISAGGDSEASIPQDDGSGSVQLITGPMGPAGPAGPMGPRGLMGPQGPMGLQGIQGEPGAVGATGSAGIAGSAGQDGAQGATGQTGPMGPQGPAGVAGPVGATGPTGATGATGATGPAGETGPMGPSGVISAASPLVYDAQTKSISLDQSAITQVGSLDYLQFSLLASATDSPGRLRWNEAAGTLNLQLRDGLATLQLGQESVQQVTNNSGVTIPNGSVVRVNGSAGTKLTVVLADNATAEGATAVIGVTTQEIASGANGYVTTYGIVHDLNTTGWNPGAPVYLNGNGSLTTVRPLNGRIVQVGFVIATSATVGSIYVNPIQNFEPIIGGQCTVPGQTGSGFYAWHNLTGARWIVVCDY